MAVCLASSFITSLSNSQTVTIDATQVSVTGDLVNSGTSPTATTSTWQGVGSWNQGLPCWAPGDPGYCGPLPYFNNGAFNFSYGYANVYQLVSIAAALPNNGTGLRVNGFNFGFTAKNGNGWDNGQQDYLQAYVNFYDSKNAVVQSYNYGAVTNQLYNWTTFNFSETFATPYAAKDLSSAQYGFVGYDTNFWAGPYGPEIYNINFSLKYSVDPCATDPLFSPTCPGYLDALAAKTKSTAVDPVTTVNTTSNVLTITPTTTSVESVAPTPSIIGLGGTPGVVSAAPTPTNPQPKVGEIQVSGAKPAVSTSQIMSMVRSELNRISVLENNTAQTAIDQAQQAGKQATEQAEATASAMSAMSISQSGTVNPATSRGNPGLAIGNNFSVVTNYSLLSMNRYDGRQSATVAPYESTVSVFSEPLRRPERQSFEVELPKPDTVRFGVRSPLNDYLDNRPFIPQGYTDQQQTETVKKNVPNNELANGVDISAMATQPVGFTGYTALALKDGAFYKPEEIYKNQRTVDNVRAQRLLQGASDRLHQELVNSQYKGQ